MENKNLENKNEEIQSRREFFKEAAKKTLPVLGAVVLSQIPFSKAEAADEQCWCGGSCQGYCNGACTGAYFLAKLGVINHQLMRNYRRHAFVVICILAAIITPTADIFTLLLVACPIALLYEFSIRVVKKVE